MVSVFAKYINTKMKFLSRILNKINPISNEKWSETLTKIVKAENLQNIKLPIILFDNEIEWEFEVFYTIEKIINDSIYSHWGGVIPNDHQLDAIAIDSNGIIYKIDNDCYNKDLKIGYSFLRKQEIKISVKELKEKVIMRAKEYIEVFDPNYKTSILKGIEQISKSNSIAEIIDLVNRELNFYKLKR